MPRFNRNTALAVGAIALIVGAVTPWVSLAGLVSVNPLTYDTASMALMGGGVVVVLLSAITGRAMRVCSILVGLLALTGAIGVLVEVHKAKADAELFGELIRPGLGLYLTLATGVYLIASTWIARRPAQAPALGA